MGTIGGRGRRTHNNTRKPWESEIDPVERFEVVYDVHLHLATVVILVVIKGDLVSTFQGQSRDHVKAGSLSVGWHCQHGAFVRRERPRHTDE